MQHPHNQTVLYFIRTLVYSELLRLSERKHFIGLPSEIVHPYHIPRHLIDILIIRMFYISFEHWFIRSCHAGLQHSTALNDLLLRAVVIAYEVAAPFGTQTLHWFAFRDCPSLLYPTPFGISRLQHTRRRTATAYGSGVLLLVVAALFEMQTLRWFTFREQ